MHIGTWGLSGLPWQYILLCVNFWEYTNCAFLQFVYLHCLRKVALHDLKSVHKLNLCIKSNTNKKLVLVPNWLKSALKRGCAGVIGVIGLFSFMLQRWNKISKNILFPINSVNLDFHIFEIFLFIFLLRAAVILGCCAKSFTSTGKWKYKELTFLFLLLLLVSFKVFCTIMSCNTDVVEENSSPSAR